ncbi:hypothetical protein CEXT_411761 [Caerostris extrusa]|uniref:Uncharacterized protein n=1 Tax=Caerostris extrusa TaxID=172846 RepID=A0AAV4TFI6_CAEEX|nr:hypothetical protein CEXT_411761 [Caerostris extrusa]
MGREQSKRVRFLILRLRPGEISPKGDFILKLQLPLLKAFPGVLDIVPSHSSFTLLSIRAKSNLQPRRRKRKGIFFSFFLFSLREEKIPVLSALHLRFSKCSFPRKNVSQIHFPITWRNIPKKRLYSGSLRLPLLKSVSEK